MLCLIFVEAYVSKSFVMDRYINDYDVEIGRIRKENTPFVKFNEGFGVGKVNSFNYLNKEYPISRDQNAIRIAIIGDSYVESFQVFDRNYFGRIMENSLSESFDYPVEVLNFGRSGFDIGDCYAYYNTFVKKFELDFAIYVLGADDFGIQNIEPLRPTIKVVDDSVFIERPYINSKYLNRFLKVKPFLSNSVLINSLNSGKKLLSKDYLLSQCFDKFYAKSTKEQKVNNASVIPEIEITHDLNLILKKLAENNGHFFLRSNIKLMNNNFTFHNITEVFEDKSYNPHRWEIANTSGHWNNKAHQDIAKYLTDKMIEIIKNKDDYVLDK